MLRNGTEQHKSVKSDTETFISARVERSGAIHSKLVWSRIDHHRAATVITERKLSNMEQDRHPTAASNLTGEARMEKRVTDLGGAATGVTYQDGMVWYGMTAAESRDGLMWKKGSVLVVS